jgi:hypothetical protein
MTTTPQAALLTDDEVAQCINLARTNLFDRAGTTSFRIARSIEQAILAKLKATQADHVPDAGEMVTQEPVQAGELPGAPERIWLQVNPEGDASDTGYPADHEGVTWCWHSIGGQEVEYVRADRAALSARKPLSGHEARELVSIHQKAVFELAKDMSDDNHKAVVSARLALLHELCPNGIGLKVKP